MNDPAMPLLPAGHYASTARTPLTPPLAEASGNSNKKKREDYTTVSGSTAIYRLEEAE